MEPEVKQEIKAPEVNLDALNAPEGTPADKFELYQKKEEVITQPTHNFSGLPNLDPKPEDKTEEPKAEDPKVEAPKVEAPKTGEEPWFHKPFKALQKRLGLTDEEFKIPEGLTEENYDEKYNELVIENTDFEGNELHPEVKKINDLIKSGMPEKEAIATYQKMNDLISLTDKEIMTLSLKQQFGKTEEKKDGWDDAKIEERVNKMDASGVLEIEAEKIRTGLKQEKENINTRYAEKNKEVIAKRNAEITEKRNTEITKSLEYLKGIKDVYGLPVGKAELQQFENDFKLLVTPNEKGIAPLNEYLQSNENLVKIAYLILNGDSKVKTALTKAKEDAKKSIIDKLDDKPNLPQKASRSQNEGAIDLEKLVAAER